MAKFFKNIYFGQIGFIGFMMSLLFSQTGHGAPALPSAQRLHQPDGSSFAARLWGDESHHGWETLDGYTVIKGDDSQYWSYARIDAAAQGMVPGGVVDSGNNRRGRSKHLRPVVATEQHKYKPANPRTLARGNPGSAVSGTRPLPVMMVNFSDTDPTFGPSDFQHLLFGAGATSMSAYYEEVSYGAFTLSAGTPGVTGWYSAVHPHDHYGENNDLGHDRHPTQLVLETVAAADPAIDFSEFDTDGDCYVDVVVIIHQGSGEEAGGPQTDIWSHQWDLDSAAFFGDGTGAYITDDIAACGRIAINEYMIQPETFNEEIQTLGVFAHEYGHTLGLPDLYDTDGSSSGIGNWGLMGAGSWNGVSRWGDSPAHPSAWSKYVLGWVKPVPVANAAISVTIAPAGTQGDVYQFFPGPQTSGAEYFLVENRQPIGFDAALPGSGLAVWHIDERTADLLYGGNNVECTPDLDCSDTHYGVSLVQADGNWDLEGGYNMGDAGDLFPGSFEKTAYTKISNPGSLLFDGSSSQVSITDIVEDQFAVTATLAKVCTITPSVIGQGRITPAGATAIGPGDAVTFAIAPDSGYHIGAVLVDGVSVGKVVDYTFTDTASDHAISVIFEPDAGMSPANEDSGVSGGGGCFIGSLIGQVLTR